MHQLSNLKCRGLKDFAFGIIFTTWGAGILLNIVMSTRIPIDTGKLTGQSRKRASAVKKPLW